MSYPLAKPQCCGSVSGGKITPHPAATQSKLGYSVLWIRQNVSTQSTVSYPLAKNPVLWIRIRGEIIPDPGCYPVHRVSYPLAETQCCGSGSGDKSFRIQASTQSKLSYPLCWGSAKINLKWNYLVDSDLSPSRNPVLRIRIRGKIIPDPVSFGSKFNLKWNYPDYGELSSGRNPVLWIRIRGKMIPDLVSFGSKINLKWNYPVYGELSTGRNPVLWIQIRGKTFRIRAAPDRN